MTVKRDGFIRVLSFMGLFLILIGSLGLYVTLITFSSGMSSSKHTSANPIGSVSISYSGLRADSEITHNDAMAFSLTSNNADVLFSRDYYIDFTPLAFSTAVADTISVGETTNIYIYTTSNNNFSSAQIHSLSTSSVTLGGATATVTLPSDPVVNEPALISLSITPVPNTPTDNAEQTQMSVNGSNAPPQEAWGSEYIETQLIAPIDTVTPQVPQKQPLGPSGAQFTWVITPKYTGPQTMSIPITEVFVPLGGTQVVKQLSVIPVILNVSAQSTTPPFFSLGQVTLGEILVILFGSVLNIPWILDFLKREKKGKNLQKAGSMNQVSATSTSQISTAASIPVRQTSAPIAKRKKKRRHP